MMKVSACNSKNAVQCFNTSTALSNCEHGNMEIKDWKKKCVYWNNKYSFFWIILNFLSLPIQSGILCKNILKKKALCTFVSPFSLMMCGRRPYVAKARLSGSCWDTDFFLLKAHTGHLCHRFWAELRPSAKEEEREERGTQRKGHTQVVLTTSFFSRTLPFLCWTNISTLCLSVCVAFLYSWGHCCLFNGVL